VVVGGIASNTPDSTFDLYDPMTQEFSEAVIPTWRAFHGSALLTNGSLLVASGQDFQGYPTAAADLFDSARETWTSTGNLNLARQMLSMVSLPNGKALVAGGLLRDASKPTATEVYDPTTNQWTISGDMSKGRFAFTLSLLHNGKVLAVGAYTTTQQCSRVASSMIRHRVIGPTRGLC
jgi:N-acetylneuraminic acid mutarotase